MVFHLKFFLYAFTQISKPIIKVISSSVLRRVNSMNRLSIPARFYHWWGMKTYDARGLMDRHFYHKDFLEERRAPQDQKQVIEYGISSFYNFLLYSTAIGLGLAYGYLKFSDTQDLADLRDQELDELSRMLEDREGNLDGLDFGLKGRESTIRELLKKTKDIDRNLSQVYIMVETHENRLLSEVKLLEDRIVEVFKILNKKVDANNEDTESLK